MPWRPCCTWTIRAKPANGCPTSTAATRTWRPSTSCGASTSWRTRCLEWSPSPKNPPRFRVYLNGLGFTMKWNMGWMHDMLHYFGEDPVHRKYHHNHITFSMLYAFTENFLLPISHDEVVYGKGSLIGKMPGDQWQKFSNARAFLGYMFTHPGKKLLFMGCDIGTYDEWNASASVPWDLLRFPIHDGLR